MTTYLILFGAHAMDHIADEDMPAVDEAAHAVCQEAIDAGVWVFGGGLPEQKASIVDTDGTVADGPSVTVGWPWAAAQGKVSPDVNESPPAA